MADRTAVVTGGGGFIGSRLAAALERHGYAVRRLDVRPGPGITVADVSTDDAWTQALHGADVVFHTAALVGEQGSDDEFWRLNVEAVRVVLDAAAAARVGRVVHFSSKVVYGHDFPDGVDETWPVRPTASPYTYTKVVAEHLALARHAAGAVPVSVVRPGDVYGPGSAQWAVRPVALLRKGVFALPDRGRGVIAATYVDDLVDAAVAVAEQPRAAGQVFNVNGGAAVSAADFFSYYARALNTRVRLLPPGAPAVVGALAAGLRRVGVEPPFSRRTFEYVTHPGTYSIAKVTEVTGWRPQVSLAEGMARTLSWLRAEGLVPPSRSAYPEESTWATSRSS